METHASSPGKIILFGEHAVVYGQPAIAAPVSQLRASAAVADRERKGVRLLAPDLGQDVLLRDAPGADALAAAVRQLQARAGLKRLPPLTIMVQSAIPIASGLGSGAAIVAALIRALARHLQRPDLAENEAVSAMTYEVEKIYHGTPSGIDNTVVSYEQTVYFVRRRPENLIDLFTSTKSLRLLLADTGIHSSTRLVVGHVRKQWQANQARYERIFVSCGTVAAEARQAIEAGDHFRVGELMDKNQQLLREMGVSAPELDRLVGAAKKAGALGAKLSGAGWGGNMIALVNEQTVEPVRQALVDAGARTVLESAVG